MARRRRKSKPLGYYDLRRFAVDGCTKKRIYTNVVDALSAARHISETSAKTCRILHGMPGAERKIATCAKRKCRTPGGERISMRKLYEAEQGAQPSPATRSGKRGRSIRNVRAKGARKIRSDKGKRRSR